MGATASLDSVFSVSTLDATCCASSRNEQVDRRKLEPSRRDRKVDEVVRLFDERRLLKWIPDMIAKLSFFDFRATGNMKPRTSDSFQHLPSVEQSEPWDKSKFTYTGPNGSRLSSADTFTDRRGLDAPR